MTANLQTLLLAALLHDIGKGSGKDHALYGAELAASVLARMPIDQEQAADIVWLIRNHLLLSDIATRRDIADESLVVEMADKISSVDRLRMLFLLSAADGLATGPQAWTPWKHALVEQLFTEIHHMLEQGTLVGGNLGAEAERKMAELKRALKGAVPADLERHISLMPREWLLSQPIQSLIGQSELILSFSPGDSVLTEARPGGGGLWDATVVAQDRPGLLSVVAGTMALHGLTVLAAQIFTRRDGLALEVFRVQSVSAEEDRFSKWQADLKRALQDDLELDSLLNAKRVQYSGRIFKGKNEAPQVILDHHASDFYTVIEVHATDRVGLLYDITSALAEVDLSIHVARVATYGQDVVDAFYVRDSRGQKLHPHDWDSPIRERILGRMGP